MFKLPVLLFAMIVIQGKVIECSAQPLPSFHLQRTGNSTFSNSDLPKGRPLILVYFDPECGHCLELTDQLFEKIKLFSSCELLLVTYKPVEELAAFETKYDTRNFPNVVVATEGFSFAMRKHYQAMIMPFTALYDQRHRLVVAYRKGTDVADLAKRVKKLRSKK
jgi:thiol-disulfide isomerase/thioredoxin